MRIIRSYFSSISKSSLSCHLDGQNHYGRAFTLFLPHGKVQTPVYMPVGTKAAIKGITQHQMEQIGCQILLANTYHLTAFPGSQYISKIGGIHTFSGWNRNILTDSGGYQMVSFGDLSSVSQEGVHFTSPYGGEEIFLRPEDSIKMQNNIGADIIMALDDVIRTSSQNKEIMCQAAQRTSRWASRCFEAHRKPQEQTLFPIIQGGIDSELRNKSLDQLIEMDALGYAIGGLSGGENKKDFFKTVKQCCDKLPKDKPRYLMGVGYPVDLVLCAALGVDMFDCVFATRTARFSTAFTSSGEIKLRGSTYEADFRPIEDGCLCETCRNYSRAYLTMINGQDNFGHLMSIHNIWFLLQTMRKLRQSILQGSLNAFVSDFIRKMYQQRDIPDWVETALLLANIPVDNIRGEPQTIGSS